MERIFIERGDITEKKVDAIVNPANSELLHGGGLAAVILEKGGRIIQEQSDVIGPIPLGEAAVTEAGKLPCRYVIHAASMSLGQLTTADSLKDSIKNSFIRAEELGIKSIAIPAVGTGVGGFSFDEFSAIALEETALFLKRYPKMEKVIFVFNDEEKFNKFNSIYQSRRNK